MSKNHKVILCVEDEDAMRKALNDKFTKEGFEVLEASDGEEGFEKAMKEKPDILIVDIMMPKMDGMSLMREVRKDEKWGTDVPIILLTNISDPENISEAAHYKVFDFLVKTDWRLDDIVKLAKQRLYLN
jgi:DNA-binding response OmpR family regulator